MVFDTTRIRFLMLFDEQMIQIVRDNTYLIIFQAEIRHTTQRCSLPLRQIFVYLIDSLRYMAEGLVEEIASTITVSRAPGLRVLQTNLRFLMSLYSSLAFLESLRAFSDSFSVSASLLSTSSSLRIYLLVNEALRQMSRSLVHSLHIGSHPFNFRINLCDGSIELRSSFSRSILYLIRTWRLSRCIKLLLHVLHRQDSRSRSEYRNH